MGLILDYTKNVCPYDVGQLLTAKYVLQWAIEECPQIPNNVCMSNVFEIIDDTIVKEVARQVRIKRLEDYSTEELIIEINSRKAMEE